MKRTSATEKRMAAAAAAGKTPYIPDEKNPGFIFSLTDSALLLAIATGRLDARALAENELVARGLNRGLAQVGFMNAVKDWARRK